ncbi:hypothetical protein SCP_0404450 [Sparassis crispa]|uniref:Uncharacterized protein n=1 Tax=Sparassis crispa TaxID=139825 RepID=A0A401GIR1_9APHY|nr:hypothetical protein SCP_0404450 [Sparassis crispa]GBE82067.1 hypothetical protein SCP_0404450 [Sparassis crispa]
MGKQFDGFEPNLNFRRFHSGSRLQVTHHLLSLQRHSEITCRTKSLDNVIHNPFPGVFGDIVPCTYHRHLMADLAPPKGGLPPPPASLHSSNQPGTPDSQLGKMTESIDKGAIWVAHIKTLSEAIIAHSEYLDSWRHHRKYTHLTMLWRFSDISDEDKTCVTMQVNHFAKQSEEKKTQLSAALSHLTELDYWPLFPSKMKTTATELKSNITELYTALQKLQASSLTVQQVTQSQLKSPEVLIKQLQSLETSLAGLKNRMDDQFLTLKVRELEQKLEVTGKKVEEIRREVAEVIAGWSVMAAENAELRHGNVQLKNEIAVLVRQQQKHQEAITASRQEIISLHEAVKAALMQPHGLSSTILVPPFELDTASLVEAVKPVILQSLHEDIWLLLEDAKNNMQNLLQEQNSQMYVTVLSKMATTVKIVEFLATWMDHLPRQVK